MSSKNKLIKEIEKLKPSLCSHMDVGDGNTKTCRKCGRKVVEHPDGFKFFYLSNGVHYFTKRPKKVR